MLKLDNIAVNGMCESVSANIENVNVSLLGDKTDKTAFLAGYIDKMVVFML